MGGVLVRKKISIQENKKGYCGDGTKKVTIKRQKFQTGERKKRKGRQDTKPIPPPPPTLKRKDTGTRGKTGAKTESPHGCGPYVGGKTTSYKEKGEF